MDRDLTRTGNSIVVVSPGSGVFEVDKSLANITRQRMMDCGVGSDCICLALPPLHVTPFFVYKKSKEEEETDKIWDEGRVEEWKRHFECPHWLNVCFVDYDYDEGEDEQVRFQTVPDARPNCPPPFVHRPPLCSHMYGRDRLRPCSPQRRRTLRNTGTIATSTRFWRRSDLGEGEFHRRCSACSDTGRRTPFRPSGWKSSSRTTA